MFSDKFDSRFPFRFFFVGRVPMMPNSAAGLVVSIKLANEAGMKILDCGGMRWMLPLPPPLRWRLWICRPGLAASMIYDARDKRAKC
jgi:hypothetical protein